VRGVEKESPEGQVWDYEMLAVIWWGGIYGAQGKGLTVNTGTRRVVGHGALTELVKSTLSRIQEIWITIVRV